ncbi:MAG: hypothetical protein BGO41_04060 [Clostridiales bacterium 38-18]|nr:MAG: hypothetical protein BGO41_04060 [Clostridiales bacterium 38-18]
MTEYQKKKLIDLILVIIAVVIVGFFLRTQLVNPIILDAETTNEAPLEVNEGKIISDQYATELYNAEALAIQLIERKSDEQYLDIQLTFKPLVDNAVADFELKVEMESDDTYTILAKSTGGKSLTQIVDNLVDADIQNHSGEILSELSVAENDNRVQIQVPNSKRLNLDAFMPMRVTLTYKVDGIEINQIYPEQ